MAKRVTESSSSSTLLPCARYASATAVAVKALRTRNGAGWSEVATTTTLRLSPSSPRSFSRNSRTSRPRSPISPTTTMSACTPRAIMPSSVDLPTPEPAKRPTRWPRPSGMNVSTARIPVGIASLMRSRRRALGRVEVVGTTAGRKRPPSIGRPSPSSTRPRRFSPGSGSIGRSPATTLQPACSPSMSPSGMSRTVWCRKPTTSAWSAEPSRSDLITQMSPSPTLGPSASTMSPATPVTRPARSTGAVRWMRAARSWTKGSRLAVTVQAWARLS
ncbi:MAG: hypothetical protein BWZ09_02615 [Alphaproteobacteria bacterium ADurb.BinA305]|nr:MAG: hypothetical protein BWZ09_02615 [Alphaproteobacteria bacterium ADurb.BinA305]